jgi:glycerophosphoryl diester phosphodiesterase
MTKIIGHRGARGLAAENTLISIVKALECDVDEIEVDVRVTADGVPVLHHDKRLSEAKGVYLAIAKHTVKDLRAVWPELTTLEEAVRSVDRRVPLMLEVKPGVPAEPVVAVVRDFLDKGWKPHDFLFASKSQSTLRDLHYGLAAIETVVIERWSGVRGSYRARQLQAKRVSMNHHFLWWGFIRSMSRSGFQLTAYTLNNRKKAERWVAHGLYGVVTDYPDRFTHFTPAKTPLFAKPVKVAAHERRIRP